MIELTLLIKSNFVVPACIIDDTYDSSWDGLKVCFIYSFNIVFKDDITNIYNIFSYLLQG